MDIMDGMNSGTREILFVVTVVQYLEMFLGGLGRVKGNLLPPNFLCDHWPIETEYFEKYVVFINLRYVIHGVEDSYDDEKPSSSDLQNEMEQALSDIRNRCFATGKPAIFDTRQEAVDAAEAMSFIVSGYSYKVERLERQQKEKKRFDDGLRRSLEATAFLHKNHPPEMLAEEMASFNSDVWPESVRSDPNMVALINKIKEKRKSLDL